MSTSLDAYVADLAARYPIPTPTTIPAGPRPISHSRIGSTPCSWVRGKRGEWEVGRAPHSLVDVFYDGITGAEETIATVATRDGRTSHVRLGRCTGIVPGTSISRYARA